MAHTSDSSQQANKEGYLDFASYNDSAPTTIILIHGALSSGSDWSLVQPYLREYHLLTPSLFTKPSLELVRRLRNPAPDADGRPAQILWKASFVSTMAALIRRYAKGGKAHIVGLSLGGGLAMTLAAAHPDLSLSLFVSGLAQPVSNPPALAVPFAKGGIWATQRLIEMLPSTTRRKLLDNEVDADPGGADGLGGKTTFEDVQILVETVTSGSSVQAFKATEYSNANDSKFRARIVAATRTKWFMPTSDSVSWAVEAGLTFAGRSQNKKIADQEVADCVDIKVFEAKRMFHPWNRQSPELFAKCIIATIKGLEFPADELKEVMVE